MGDSMVSKNRRQSIAADEYAKGQRGRNGSMLSWLYCRPPLSPMAIGLKGEEIDGKDDSPTEKELLMEQFVFDLYLNSPTKQRRKLDAVRASEDEKLDKILNPTNQEASMEQVIFDLYLNSPSKMRRQEEAVRASEKEKMRKVLYPTNQEATMEQVMFDIYLNSPTRKRRQIEARKVWEKNEMIHGVRHSCFPTCKYLYPTLEEPPRRGSIP